LVQGAVSEGLRDHETEIRRLAGKRHGEAGQSAVRPIDESEKTTIMGESPRRPYV
jgi:hypothetical protein